jgi:hypothetical protein
MEDLETLRAVFQDYRQHIGIGLVVKLGLANDNSLLRVQVRLLPENREIIAYMTFADVYDVTFPELNDLVIVAFANAELDEAHVISIVNSSEEKIPLFARIGHTTKYARAGKKLYLGSDTKIGIARPDKEPIQPLVLGTILKNALTDFLNDFLNAPQIGQCAVGPVFLDPTVRTNLTAHMATYITNAATNIVSQIGFTERGTE